ncbi:MAG: hypothetical protein JW984_15155 [Deltaproteobacteria bacterium]|uniref:Uncharacterized protein n=1 Tax=Candidatus Zymogenus saltonus TaxID=2844893 RepID=A0A9D8PR83_9DELT|nr:hypothetical protein [Candidatus Zymogenus saltonus]
MLKKVKKFISRVWAKIKADLQKNLQATKAFIWANEAISKAAERIYDIMTSIRIWTEKRTNEWQSTERTLLEEQEKKRVEDLKSLRDKLQSELDLVNTQLSGK